MGATTFVGRLEALRSLDDATRLAAGRDPQVVVVSGESGVGKSALLSAFSRQLEAVTILDLSGDELETSLEFGLVDQILGEHREWRDPYAAGIGILQYLGHLPADQLSAILIDDAHLVDQSSLAALNFTVRRLSSDPIVVVLGIRPDGTSRLPAGLFHRAEGAGTLIELGGLTTDEVRALAVARGAGALSHRAAERLRRHTGGSPLHLCALLDEISIAGLENLDHPLPAPHSFALLVLRDIAAVTPAARRLVSTAAVLGEHADTGQLLQVAGLDPGQAPAAMAELHVRGLLLFPPGSSQVRFRHPLVRAAILEDIGPGIRAELHQRAAEVLPGTVGLGHRVAATLAPDEALATELEREAGDQARAGHLAAASDAWLAAARLSPTVEDAGRRLLNGIGMLLAAGDVAAALRHSDRVNALPENGPRLYVQAQIALLTGHGDEAAALGRRAWDRLTELAPGQGDQLAALLARIDMLLDHGADAARWAATALHGRLDPAQAPLTRALRAQSMMTSGQGRAGLAEFADLPEDPDDVEMARHPELATRGMLRTFLGQFEQGDRDLVVAASLAHGDLSPFRLTARACLAITRFRRGDWRSAQAVAEDVVALAEDMEQPWLAAYLHATASLVPSGRGDWDTAEHHVDAATAAALRLGDPASAHYAADAKIHLAMCHCDPGSVVRTAAALIDPGLTTPGEPGLLTWPVHLVEALVQLGRLDEAKVELDRVEDLARRRQHPSRLAASARLRGQLADARRDHTTARAAFDQAMALGNDAVEGVDADERATAHLSYGTFLRRRGERRAATEHAREARSRYTALGAAPFVGRAEDLLTGCGAQGGSEAVVVDDWAKPLTSQEQAVAVLIAEGRTNQQAANELVVSVKTIGYHLQNVYTKLDVHSRAQLANRLAAVRHPG